MHAMMHSQQPWIIASQDLSPLVHVIVQPSLVISILQTPHARLQQQTIMPFIMQQTLAMDPAVIWQRFCTIERAASSSQRQVIFMPPLVFSTFMVQRGTIIMLGAIGPIMPGIGEPMPIPIPGAAEDIPVDAIEPIIAFIIGRSMIPTWQPVCRG